MKGLHASCFRKGCPAINKIFTLLRRPLLVVCTAVAVATFCALNLFAENCVTASDTDPATRAAMVGAGQRYFDLIAKGDAASLRQNAIPSLAAEFFAIEATVKDNQSALAGAKGTARPPFLLEADGTAPIPRAEFYCGVFGKNGQTSDSAAFYLNNLPPGKYAVVIFDAPTSKGPYTVSFILQQIGSDWKLGGLYVKASEIAGHNNDWFVTHAREFKTKGQLHDAWLYYLEARSLISPLPFMSTAATDKLYDESQKAQPADLPADGKTVDLPAGTTTYKLVDLFPELVGNDLDLIVKYQVPDASNTNLAYQDNIAVMKALLTKYPELRDAFTGVVARAGDPSGHDYGTLLAMKDIK
ncbi:MAG: hypothetical protein WB523_19685 [Candidatus Sulfotelmatobacter sp.]